MIRIISKFLAVTVFLTAFLHVAPLFAAPVVWISSTGSDANSCTAAQPCSSIFGAINQLDEGGQINCLNSPGIMMPDIGIAASFTFDCAGVYEPSNPATAAIQLLGAGQVAKIRNLTISGTAGGYPAIKVTGSGTLILENCVFENFNASGAGPALDIEPNGALNLVIKNSRVSNNTAAGVLIKPQAGGSVKATFDGVTITNNAGGLHTDSTKGAVTVDISNSTVSYNANNGLAIIGGSSGSQNIVSLSHDVIALNGQAGIEASGAAAAVLVDTTLLDQNASGATLIVSVGKVLSYGNNRVIGPSGSGFTSTTPLQ